ncbi:MAG: hypothetical protein ACU83N_07070 [Gammaproteobacteria bacterium]
MTVWGVIMMGISFGVSIALMVYCFYRILRIPRSELREHAPLEIDTGDQDSEDC